MSSFFHSGSIDRRRFHRYSLFCHGMHEIQKTSSAGTDIENRFAPVYICSRVLEFFKYFFIMKREVIFRLGIIFKFLSVLFRFIILFVLATLYIVPDCLTLLALVHLIRFIRKTPHRTVPNMIVINYFNSFRSTDFALHFYSPILWFFINHSTISLMAPSPPSFSEM